MRIPDEIIDLVVEEEQKDRKCYILFSLDRDMNFYIYEVISKVTVKIDRNFIFLKLNIGKAFFNRGGGGRGGGRSAPAGRLGGRDGHGRGDDGGRGRGRGDGRGRGRGDGRGRGEFRGGGGREGGRGGRQGRS